MNMTNQHQKSLAAAQQITTHSRGTDTYQRIETTDLMDTIERVLESRGERYSQTYTRCGGRSRITGLQSTKHEVCYRLLDRTIDVNGSAVNPTISFFNSYRGESSCMIYIGAYVFKCSNGLVIGEDFYHQRIIHRVGPTYERKMRDMEYQIVAALDAIEDTLATVAEATRIPVTPEQEVEIIGSLHVPKKVKDRAIRLVYSAPEIREAEGGAGTSECGTIWGTYNMVNQIRREESKSLWTSRSSDGQLLADVIALRASLAA